MKTTLSKLFEEPTVEYLIIPGSPGDNDTPAVPISIDIINVTDCNGNGIAYNPEFIESLILDTL